MKSRQEIEPLFEKEDTLDKVLDECQASFDRVNYYAGIMKDNLTNNPEEAKKSLNELTGIFMSLKPILIMAATEKKNREIRFYDKLRIDTENEDKKFVSSVADKQAGTAVASYRRVRNIIQGYTDACEKAISTLQSILRFLSEEMKLSGRTQE